MKKEIPLHLVTEECDHADLIAHVRAHGFACCAAIIDPPLTIEGYVDESGGHRNEWSRVVKEQR